MASVIGTCVLLFAIVPVSAAFVKVDCTSENLGQYGQDSVLKCVINTTEEASDAMITSVKWKKIGNEKKKNETTLVVFGKDHPNEPRFRFSVENLTGTTRDVSLLVSNTQINDSGEYECTVKTDSGPKDTIKTNLSVTAKYSAPVIIAEKDTDTSLICSSEGGYPKGTIQWFDQEGKKHTSTSQQEPKPMDDKPFNLTSKLTLKNSASSQYTCQVYNANGDKEGETTFNLSSKISGHEGVHEMVQDGKVAASNIVAPVVVIGSLIVGLLIVLLWRKRQSNGGHTPIDQDEEKANWQGGEAAAGGKKCEHSEETNTLEEERCQAMITFSAAPTN